MHTKDTLKEQIAALGIASDDTVLIHTSFKSLGEVEGGPNTLIDAFCEYLSVGLFIVPTHTWANVTKDEPVYDPMSTEPCIGLVPRTAYKRKDGIRSLHPTHSVWVHGKGAQAFIKGEESSQTPAPVGGSWWKLGELKAKILLIGVNHGRNTYIHAVDEIAELDDRLVSEAWSVSIKMPDGSLLTHPFRNHGETGSENFNNFEKAFIGLGAQKNGMLGDATVRVVDAAKCRDILLNIYSKTKENLCLEAGDIPETLWE